MMTERDRVSGGSRTGPAPRSGLRLLLQERTAQVGEWTAGHVAEDSERGSLRLSEHPLCTPQPLLSLNRDPEKERWGN